MKVSTICLRTPPRKIIDKYSLSGQSRDYVFVFFGGVLKQRVGLAAPQGRGDQKAAAAHRVSLATKGPPLKSFRVIARKVLGGLGFRVLGFRV